VTLTAFEAEKQLLPV